MASGFRIPPRARRAEPSPVDRVRGLPVAGIGDAPARRTAGGARPMHASERGRRGPAPRTRPGDASFVLDGTATGPDDLLPGDEGLPVVPFDAAGSIHVAAPAGQAARRHTAGTEPRLHGAARGTPLRPGCEGPACPHSSGGSVP